MRSVPILLFATALGVSLFAAAPARADTLAITQNLFGSDGWPTFVVNANPQGANGTRASWQVCSPDCGPVVAQGAQFEAGPVAPGTTIQASSAVGGTTLTATSKPWLGRVAATAPPTVSGTPRIGATVLPVGGAWTGGFGDERSLLSLRACRTPAATDCRPLPSANPTGPALPLKLTTAYAGFYIGAVDSRFAADTIFTLGLRVYPPGVIPEAPAPPATPDPEPAQTIAFGPLVGPVPRATRTQLARWAPRTVIRPHAEQVGRLLRVAEVTCPEGCATSATLWLGSTRINRTERVVAPGDTHRLTVPTRTFRAGATIHVRVRVRDFPATAGRSRLPK